MRNSPANYRNELFRLFMKKRYGELIAVIAVMLFIYLISPAFNTSSGTADTLHGAALFPVVRVVDGDTFVYEDGGQDFTVRMVGIDTPETVDPRKPVQCFGKEASNKTKSLIEGKKVTLEKDTLGDTIDKYQRQLRNVYLEDGTMVNEILIKEGYATVTRGYSFSQKEHFIELENQARIQGKGLWDTQICPE